MSDEDKARWSQTFALFEQINPKIGWQIALDSVLPIGKSGTLFKTLSEGNREFSPYLLNQVFDNQKKIRKTNRHGKRAVHQLRSGYTLQLIGESPSQDKLSAIQKRELALFLKNDRLYCKVQGKDEWEIIRTDGSNVAGIDPKAFDRIKEAVKKSIVQERQDYKSASDCSHFTEEDRKILLGWTSSCDYTCKLDDKSIYAKFYPELPGTELAVSKLMLALIGYGAPYGELGELEGKPVLLSQAIQGDTLYEIVKNKPHILKELDPYHLSAAIVMAMLINPEDGSPTNYIVSPPIAGKQTYRIFSIDQDHAFMPAVAREIKTGWLTSKPSLQVKTILYCMDAMKHRVHPDIVSRFENLDPYEVLEPWLKDLFFYDQLAKSHFHSDKGQRQVNFSISDGYAKVVKNFRGNEYDSISYSSPTPLSCINHQPSCMDISPL